MHRILDFLARYGERHLAAPPPGPAAIATVLGLAGLGIAGVVYAIAAGHGVPVAMGGFSAFLLAGLILQTMSLQLAHRRVLARSRFGR